MVRGVQCRLFLGKFIAASGLCSGLFFFFKWTAALTWLTSWVLVCVTKQDRTKPPVYSSFFDLHELWTPDKLNPREEINIANVPVTHRSFHHCKALAVFCVPRFSLTNVDLCAFCEYSATFGTLLCWVQKLGGVSAPVPDDREVLWAPFCWLIEAADLRQFECHWC